MSKVSLGSQIAAVEAAACGTAAPSRAAQRELHQTHLSAAAATLRWLQQNERLIRAVVENEART